MTVEFDEDSIILNYNGKKFRNCYPKYPSIMSRMLLASSISFKIYSFTNQHAPIFESIMNQSSKFNQIENRHDTKKHNYIIINHGRFDFKSFIQMMKKCQFQDFLAVKISLLD